MGHFSGFIRRYIVDGWESRLGGDYGDHPRLFSCDTFTKQCKTPATHSDFYLASVLLPLGGGRRVGSFCDEFPPYHYAVKKVQGAVLNDLVKTPVISEADLEGSGIESAQSPLRPVNNQCPITLEDWRGPVEPDPTARSYLDACKRDFCLNAIVECSAIGDRLVTEYGSYQLGPRAIQEYMIGQKDHLCRTSANVTFNNPELTQRSIDVRTVCDIPLFRGPPPKVFDVGVSPMANLGRNIFLVNCGRMQVLVV